MSLLGIEGMRFHAFHGFYKEEHLTGNNFVVDVYITAALENANETDKIRDTINYETVYAICKRVMNEQYDLIEKVAGEIISHLLSLLIEGDHLKVRVRKLFPPMPGIVDSTFIELEKIK
ncbi:MAG TPA: dihydroneopterin aldolase [Saprospiraceae bacterium]|nr:dihydroneopterin aldolase [Saprospiraceae bacterium]